MKSLIAYLSENYKGIERPINSIECRDYNKRIDNSVCCYCEGIYYVNKDNFDEFLNIILEYTDLELDVSNSEVYDIVKTYHFYKKIEAKIPCEMIIGFWTPTEIIEGMNLDLIGIDLCDQEYESLLKGTNHVLFHNEDEAKKYLLRKDKQYGNIVWHPLYVYRVLDIDSIDYSAI